MSDGEEQSIKSRAREIALAMVVDSTSGKAHPVDSELQDNPELAAELRRQLKLLGVVKLVTEESETRREAQSPVSVGHAELDTTRVVNPLDTGGPLHDDPTLIPCPSCRQHLPQVVFAKNESSRKVQCLSCGHSVVVLDNRKGLQAGSMVAQFELLSRLGAGSFGLVWKARDTRLQRDVALKVPRRGLLTSDQQNLFLREAKVAAAIRHPYVVAIHDTGVDRGTVYICSELIDGTTLSQWSHESCDSPRTAAAMMRKIALAIQAIHESSVVHRDLKPSNVMVDKNEDPQVMDFGLAKQDVFEATMTLSGEVLGTPAYMSPEAAKGESRSSDPRTDIYSIGVMLYELLTGELPFRGDFAQLVQQILHAKPRSLVEINPAVHRELETICLKCLEKEPADRYQSARELAEDLERFEEGRPVMARPKSLSKRILRASQARPALALLVVSLAAVLVLLIAATQYVHVAMDSNASNEVDNQVLRQLQDKKLQSKQEQLQNKQDELAAVEDDLSAKKREVRVRDKLLRLNDQSQLAKELALVNPVGSLQLVTTAVHDLSELDEGDLKLVPAALVAERGKLLVALQQGLVDSLQRWGAFPVQDFGELVGSVQTQQSRMVGALSVDRSFDQVNPYLVTVIDMEAGNVRQTSDVRFTNYRLSSAVNRLAMKSDGSLILGFHDDESDGRSADRTRLLRPFQAAKSLIMQTSVNECCFPVWSDDVWVLDSYGKVSCWSAEVSPGGKATRVFQLDLPLPVTNMAALAGVGELALSFDDGVSAVQIDGITGEVNQTRIAGSACQLVPLQTGISQKKSAEVRNLVCYWDSVAKHLVLEAWEPGKIDAERQSWKIHLSEVEDVRASVVSERGDWICANVQTVEGPCWKFVSLRGPREITGGMTLLGDPARGMKVRPQMEEFAVATRKTVFHYKIQDAHPVLKNEFSDDLGTVTAFCWLGDRSNLAIGFDNEVDLQCVAEKAEARTRRLEPGEDWLLDGKVMKSLGDSISALYSDSSGEYLVSIDKSGAMSLWDLGRFATDVLWQRRQSRNGTTRSRIQLANDGGNVAVLNRSGELTVYPRPRFLLRNENPKKRVLQSPWVAWEKSSLLQQNVSDFALQGSTLAVAGEGASTRVYRVDKTKTQLLAQFPIHANKVVLSVDQHWLCLQQAATLYVFDLRRPRQDPWEINGIDEGSEVTFIGAGHCFSAIGEDRVLRAWNPLSRTCEEVQLSPLSSAASPVINGTLEAVFPMDDGRVFMLRQTEGGGYVNAGFMQIGKARNSLNLVPAQAGDLWAMASIPAPTAKADFHGAAVQLGHFQKITVHGSHSGNAWGFVGSENAEHAFSSLETPRRDRVESAMRPVMAISPDQRWLVRSSRAGFDSWQLSTQKIVPNPSQRGASDSATQLVFSSDGKWMASGHESGMVRFWKIDGSGILLSKAIEWSIHSSPIESIVIDPDSRWCFCTSSDRISCIPIEFDLLLEMARARLKAVNALTPDLKTPGTNR
jgi:serine/threonine protein kinase/WD40 repeat protein